MSNTIDLRGLEQVCTRLEAEQYAAMLGYKMFIFGRTEGDVLPIYDVDLQSLEDTNAISNRLIGHMEYPDILEAMDKAGTYVSGVHIYRACLSARAEAGDKFAEAEISQPIQYDDIASEYRTSKQSLILEILQ